MKTKDMKLRFFNHLILAALALATLLSGCKKGETMDFDVPSESILFEFEGYDIDGTTTFTSENVSSVNVSSVPSGWEIVAVDMYEKSITVHSPKREAIESKEAVDSGTINLKVFTPSGKEKSVSIYVAILANEDINYFDKPANCYIANKYNRRYLFNPMIGGSSTPLNTSYIEIIWQTSKDVIKYIDMQDGVASFYVEERLDENDKPSGMLQMGNALIGAFSESGELLWTWHIWVTNSDPENETITLNGRTLMNINLGADINSEGEGNGDDNRVGRSYGLYYQWGRRTPFVGPATWNFWSNKDLALYNNLGYSIYLDYVASDETTGDVAWAVNNPLSVITGYKDNSYDWLFSGHDQLWDENSKSEHDPCPNGWRVPDSSIYENLTISSVDDNIEDWAVAQKMYGWHLEDANGSYFFSAAGRRNYLDGKLDNMNDDNTTPIPWSGYYWTSSVDDSGDAKAMWFDLNSESRALWNGFDAARSMHRANAMPIRCVRE
jgi:uncharacterized protein (TIGR02145 family)